VREGASRGCSSRTRPLGREGLKQSNLQVGQTKTLCFPSGTCCNFFWGRISHYYFSIKMVVGGAARQGKAKQGKDDMPQRPLQRIQGGI